MKWHSLSSLIFAVLVTTGYSREPLLAAPKKREAVRTTAYTHTEADHLQYGRKTAAGTTLRNERAYTSAAADWSKYPLGTKFKIEGMDTTFVVDDYGRALVGTETIDLYHPSKSAMNRWGVRHVDIEVVEMGDFERSREILAQRTKYDHVRKMLAGIDQSAKAEEKGLSLFKRAKRSGPVETAAPAQPSLPVAPGATTQPSVQLASSPSSPSPNPAATRPSPPVAPIPGPPPAALVASAPAPALASKSVPTKPSPQTPAEIIAAGMASAPLAPSIPSPAVAEEPTPALPPVARKVRPLSIELASSHPELSAGVEAPVAAAAMAPAEPKKRNFRPL